MSRKGIRDVRRNRAKKAMERHNLTDSQKEASMRDKENTGHEKRMTDEMKARRRKWPTITPSKNDVIVMDVSGIVFAVIFEDSFDDPESARSMARELAQSNHGVVKTHGDASHEKLDEVEMQIRNALKRDTGHGGTYVARG